MKFLAFLVAGLFFAAPVSAFEGEIWGTMTAGQQMKMRMFFNKKGDVRLDSEIPVEGAKPETVSLILPAKGDKYYMVSESQRTVLEAPYSATPQSAPSEESDNIEIKKLGNARIAGVRTQHVQFIDKDTGGTTDFWIAPSYPYDLLLRASRFNQRGPGVGFATKATEAEMKKQGIKPGLIMKMISTEPGKPNTKFEVEKIQKKKVAGSTFVPPKDYKRTQMPDIDMSGFKAPKTREEAEKLRQEMMERYGR